MKKRKYIIVEKITKNRSKKIIQDIISDLFGFGELIFFTKTQNAKSTTAKLIVRVKKGFIEYSPSNNFGSSRYIGLIVEPPPRLELGTLTLQKCSSTN
jgi:hypothetical protein